MNSPDFNKPAEAGPLFGEPPAVTTPTGKPKAPTPPNADKPETPFPWMKPGRCDSCNARILWAPTDKGKNAPLDEVPVTVMFVDLGTQVVFARRAYVNHFATCPSAKQHRKPKEKA